jgi:hypothetical protein
VFRFSQIVLSLVAVVLLSIPAAIHTKPSERFKNDSQSLRTNGDRLKDANLLAAYEQLPLAFERNQGQSSARVEFLSRGRGYALFLTDNEAVVKLHEGRVGQKDTQRAALQPRSAVLRMRLAGARSDTRAIGLAEMSGKSNYFIGNDRSKWIRNVANYAKVKYTDVYPGIDLVYYGKQGELEYDFVVAPGADPNLVRLQLEGSERRSLHLDSTGGLIADTAAGDVRFRKPQIYQKERDGRRKIVDGGYKLLRSNLVGFEVADYDKSRELVIDPVVSYSSFLGGTGPDAVNSVSVAFDSAGNAYVASGTESTDFPVSAGAYQSTYGGGPAICDQGSNFCGDAFVTKINSSGTAIVYSTYLGGSNTEYAFGLAVDGGGNAYITGQTESTNFPVTPGAFQPNFGGFPAPCDDYDCGDAFVSKLDPAGSTLIYSSYLGGSGNDHTEALVVDAQGNAYVAGDTGSANFPTTPGAFQTQLKGTDTCGGRDGATVVCHNAFLTKVNPTGTKLVYSTYLGGSSGDGAGGVVVDSVGRATAVGSACSADFPVTAGAFQETAAGGCDIFVSTFNATGSQLVYSTYFGGTGYEATYGAAVDKSNNVYIAGFTYSTDFPVTAGAAQTVYGGNGDAIVAKFNPVLSGAASLVYSTYLGGSQSEIGADVAVDSQGNAYAVGQTFSSDFPVISPLQGAKHGTSDVFLTEVNPRGSAFLLSTFLGGSADQLADNVAVDRGGNVYVAGWTRSGDFPSTPRAFQPGFAGGITDLFVVKISPNNAAGVSFTPPALAFAPQAVGTTSPPQTVIIHDLGSAALVISSISTVGDFAQTNNCSAAVAGGGTCAVTVTFTPSRSGTRSGGVSVSDNAAGGTQVLRLSGTGK